MSVKQRERARFLRNWRDERDSAALYGALAALERNPRLSRVFARLAEAERQHSAYWERRLHESGQTVPKFRPSLRARLMMQLARQFGVAFVVPSITTRELADHQRYSGQEDAIAAGLSKEERGHAAVMRRVATYGSDAEEGEEGVAGGMGHLGNNLRAAVLGANDGLASNFCLLMGVAGGAMPAGAIVLTGVAGLVAGACSMALGEWLSVTNACEMARSHTDTDARELHTTTVWKREELALMHEARGMSEEAAQQAAARVLAQEPEALHALIREERVIAVAGRSHNAASAAAYSFLLFALGASVPLLPFLFASGRAIAASITLSLVALFAVGLLTSFFNGRSPIFSGLRQVGVGAAAAAVTYAAGRLVGAVITSGWLAP